ncbi:MAG: hypothetical protein IPK60_02595 [Sandaracinaceae bacterium]|nr:hypothetical protein [Sandaracinaceae bacterium]
MTTPHSYTFVSLAALLVACSSSAAKERSEEERAQSAPPPFSSQHLDDELARAAEAMRTRGFSDDGTAVRGFVVEHAAHVTEAPLRTSACYVVVATSSSALRALSLEIFDSEGLAVANSEAISPRVALRYCPAQSGTYYVSARAATGSGLFALRRFRGPTGIAVRLDDLFGAPVAAPSERSAP